MKFTKRQVEILHYLNEYRETTIKQISQKIGVTGQTIKAEIMALEDILKAYDITVEFQSGKGIKVDGGNHLQELLKVSERNIECPIQDQILLLLLLNRDYLVLQDIADKLFISKSQVEKLMPGLIKSYQGEIHSARHYGYRYDGTEINRRNLFVKLIGPYMRGTDVKKRFCEFHETHFPIKEYFRQELIDKGLEVLQYILELKNFTFTDLAIKQLFLHLIFILKTNEEKEITVMGEEFLTGIKMVGEFQCYRERVEEMNEALALNLREGEEDYLAYLFMTLKKKKVVNKEEILKEMRSSIEHILEEIKVKLFIDLTQDENLIEGLSYHIYTTTLTRPTAKYTPDHSTWLEIKRHYPLGYEMAALSIEFIKEHYEYTMDEQEIMYLALHFQAAIEKLKQIEQRIKTIIVCHFGVAACHLISRRIERFFPQIDIVGTYSVQEFMELEEVGCELIISTESLPNTEATTLYVTPALKEVELERVREFVRTRNTKYLITNEITEAIMVHFNGAASKEEVINQMVGILEREGYVSEQYLESVYERENISSTAMQDIAVPHGNPKYVHKMKLAIGRINPSVTWEDEEVKYVFLLVVTGELLQQNSRVFTNFYKKISDLEFEMNLNELDEKDDEAFKKALIRLFK